MYNKSATMKSREEQEEKIEWLRSQLIGDDIEFETPFGKRKLTYADHTATGRSLHYIEGYIIEQVLPFYGNTHTNDSFVGKKTTRMVSEATSYIKKCTGATKDDMLLFCGSGATSSIKKLQENMGIAVPSNLREKILQNLKDEERWVVFIGPYEHHSNLLSWRQSLAEVVEIGVDENGLIDIEALSVELKSPKFANRPMLGSFSACSNVTGIVCDTREIARVLHRYGAFACFDFAASGPYVEIDMRSGEIEGYDAVFLSPHKFIGGPGSPGILLMNKSLYQLANSPPSTCGGGTVSYVNGFNDKDTIYYNDIEEREDAGTPPIIQKIRCALAFWVKECIGYELMEVYENFYIDEALKRLRQNPNISILGNLDAKRLPVISFLVYPGENSRIDKKCKGKPLNGGFVATLLNDLFGIQARGGCACAGPYGHRLLKIDRTLSLKIRSLIEKGYNGVKPGWTRISFSYYMPKDEFGFIMDCIEFVAAFGHRFLSLYQFDWATGDWTFKMRAFKYHLIKEEFALESSNDLYKMKNRDNDRSSYLESARRTALSLPGCQGIISVPDDIDRSLVLFRL